MKKGKLLAVLLLALALSMMMACATMTGAGKQSPTLAKIQEKGVLKIATTASMPPLNMKNKQGKVIGFEIDLATAMARAMGVQLEVVEKPFTELLPTLEAGEVDMVLSGMTMTAERNLKVAFAGPYHVSGKAFLTRIESIATIKRVVDLNAPNMSFAALEGSTSETLVKSLLPRAKYVPVKNYDEAVKMLVEGKLDALVADYHACVVGLLRHPDKGLLPLITPFTYEPLGIALPPGDAHLLNWTNNFLTAYEETDGLLNLKLRWIEDASWLKELP